MNTMVSADCLLDRVPYGTALINKRSTNVLCWTCSNARLYHFDYSNWPADKMVAVDNSGALHALLRDDYISNTGLKW